MNVVRLLAVLLGVLAVVLAAVSPSALAAAPAAGASASPVTGNLSGPGFVATSTNGTFYLNATGGPAVTGGELIGTLSWTASLSGSNLTGSSVSPTNGSITNATHQPVSLTVTAGAIAETLTLSVKVTSTLGTSNATGNFSKSFRVVTPYTVRATLIAGPDAAVLPFNISVALDGTLVGTVTVPKILPNATYAFAYRYPSVGLSAGEHTFTLTIEAVHGLVTFSNGRTVLTTTFYVAGAPADNTVWIVIGVVAFFGVLFIYATRAAARRRAPGRK